MLKVSRERNTQRNRRESNYDQRDTYRGYDNYYSDFDYDTIDLNDEYDYQTKYDVDFAYDDYSVFDEQPRYVEPCTEPRYSSFRNYAKDDARSSADRKKKRKMSTGTKALVVVYLAIVAVIATLLIINALPVMNATNQSLSIEGMENIETVEVDNATIHNVTMADGSVVTIPVANSVPYEYTINSNWFDNMCDWMENMVA